MGRCRSVGVEREPGGGLGADGPFAVVAGRDLDVDASGAAVGVGVLDLGVRVEHVPFVVEGESEFAGGAVPFGIGGPLAVLQPALPRCRARRRS